MYVKNLQPVQLLNTVHVASGGNCRMEEKSPPFYCINSVLMEHCSSNKSSYLPNFHVIEIDVQMIRVCFLCLHLWPYHCPQNSGCNK